MTCQECHTRKAKCNNKIPCERCTRLNRECLPYVSKQGKKRLRSDKEEQASDASDKNDGECVLAGSDLSKFGSQHYGLNFIIRSWVAQAFRRRSFKLLHRATALAIKNDINMDQILCGRNLPGIAHTHSSPATAAQANGMGYMADLLLQLEEFLPAPWHMSVTDITTRLQDTFSLEVHL